MSKFGKLVRKTFSYVGTLFATHPVTFFTVCAGTLLAFLDAFFLTDAFNKGWAGNEPFNQILMQFILTAVLFCLFAFCIESSPLKKVMPLYVSIPVHVAGALFSFIQSSLVLGTGESEYILFYDIFTFYRDLFGTTRVILVVCGIAAILFFTGVYFLSRRPEISSFSSYCTHVFSALFFAGITFSVLMSGTGSLTGIFTLLLWGDFEKIYLPILMLLLGGYFIMRCISCFTEKPGEVNGFIYVLVHYVMTIMCMIAYVIIYAYMLKILILREFPSNSVYAILTALFVISMPIVYMSAGMTRRHAVAEADNNEQDAADPAEAGAPEQPSETEPHDAIAKIARILPLVFAPFVLLQIYTVFVRIRQYGLTPKRYFGVIFILFEITAIVLYLISLLKKSFKMQVLLPVFAGFVLFATLLPFTNAIGLSRTVQSFCIDAYLSAQENVAESDKYLRSRAAAAYEYLLEDKQNKKYLETHHTAKECDRLDLLIKRADVETEEENLDHTISSWATQENELNLDISGYTKLQYAYLAALDDPVNLKSVGLYLNDQKKIPRYPTADEVMEDTPAFSIDLSDYGNRFLDLSVSHHDDLSDREYQIAMQEIQIITVSDQAIFVVMDAEIDYDDVTGKISELLLSGYYLSK